MTTTRPDKTIDYRGITIVRHEWTRSHVQRTRRRGRGNGRKTTETRWFIGGVYGQPPEWVRVPRGYSRLMDAQAAIDGHLNG